MMSLAAQTYSFLMTIMAGGVIGFLFDLYRVIRSHFRSRQVATAMTDLVFWIVVTPTTFALLLASNWAELRLYVAIGIALGLLLYFQALSSIVIWFLAGFFKRIGLFLGSLIYALVQGVMAPFIFVRNLFFGRRRVGPRTMWRGRGPAVTLGGFRPRVPMAWRRFSLARFFHRAG